MIEYIKNLSIRSKIFLSILAIVTIGFAYLSLMLLLIATRNANQLVQTASQEVNKQIVMNYENYIDNIIRTANSLQIETANQTKNNQRNELENTYSLLQESSSSIVSISLIDSNGDVIVDSFHENANTNYLNDVNYINAKEDHQIFHFSSLEYHPELDIDLLSVTKSVEYYQEGVALEGVLFLEMDTSQLQDLSLVTNLGDNGHLMIFDETGKIVFTSLYECKDSTCVSIEFAKELLLGGKIVEIENVKYYLNVNTIRDTRWKIATFTNIDAITQTNRQMISYMALAVFVMLLVAGFLSSFISNRISSPLLLLNNQMKRLSQGHFHEKVTVTGQKEVTVLGDTYNEMVDEIKQLMADVQTEQRAKRRTQFVALQNQINPHFLYNTLDSIVWLSEQQRNEDVQEMIIALSKYFRVSISSESNLVTLEEELNHIKSYLLIQKIRYHNSFDYDILVDETMLASLVMKFSLQPLVENAIYHGISPKEDFSKITIKCVQDEIFYYLSVENEGYGLSNGRINEIRETFKDTISTASIGLKNIYQRLKLIYGTDADLLIESKLDYYTKITVKIPKKRGVE